MPTCRVKNRQRPISLSGLSLKLNPRSSPNYFSISRSVRSAFDVVTEEIRLQHSEAFPLTKMAAAAGSKWKNTALLVIDMQNDFILPGGPMHVKGGEAIVPNVIKTVEVSRSRGIPVIWVVREHDPSGRDVELFRRHLYSAGKPKPTSKGSKGAELVDGLEIKDGDYKLVKTRFSAFFNTHLHSYLQGVGVKNLVIIGVQTPNCIRQTVFDAVALDYQTIIVIVDATAAATPDIHIANIFDMSNIGVAIPTLEEWCTSDN